MKWLLMLTGIALLATACTSQSGDESTAPSEAASTAPAGDASTAQAGQIKCATAEADLRGRRPLPRAATAAQGARRRTEGGRQRQWSG